MIEINEWKKKYGKIYRIESCGEMWYFRGLTVGEYRTISLIDDHIEKERTLLSLGILYPAFDHSTIPSGTGELLSNAIGTITDISQDSILRKVQEKRDLLGMADDFVKWKIQIIKNLNYTPEQVDNMSLDKFIESLVLVEEIVGMPLVAQGQDVPTEMPPDRAAEPEDVLVDDMKVALGGVAEATADTLRAKYVQERMKRRKALGRK